MKKYLFSILMTLAAFSPRCKSSVPSDKSVEKINGERVAFSELDAALLQIMNNAGVAGLSCAIINDSKIVYQKAFGYRDENTGALNNTETIFRAASFSKTVFAYLVMLLAEDGIIDLDRPLQDYLDRPLWEYPTYADLDDDPRAARITARMVLRHTTGFPNWRFLTNDGKLRIMFEPGSRFSYSGEGIHLLQMVVEKITGKGLEALKFRERR